MSTSNTWTKLFANSGISLQLQRQLHARTFPSACVRQCRSFSTGPHHPSSRSKSTIAATARVQTSPDFTPFSSIVPPTVTHERKPRSSNALTDKQVAMQVEQGKVKFFNIEGAVGDNTRAVKIRRDIVAQKTNTAEQMKDLPYLHYNYEQVAGQCCENVIGHVPIPVGVAGPILVDGKEFFLPMATTEGALVASTTRGCKALSIGGGVNTAVVNDAMARAPVLGVNSVKEAMEVKEFIDENFAQLAEVFNSTSRFARLQGINCRLAGRKLHVRFTSTSGDAMGMNMVGKACEQALSVVLEAFPHAQCLSLSGNVCTDKKPSAINLVEGRGKTVVADAVLSKHTVEKVLKTTISALCELNVTKNLVGSALAGSIGGQNAHASNIVTAMFLATGQDPAQNVESSNCLTLMEPTVDANGEEALYMSVNLPCLEVGTVGGGTSLPGQSAMLSLLGVKGAHPTEPGANARQLARQVAAGVMAGELSLMSALSAGHLIKSHMALNRKVEPKK